MEGGPGTLGTRAGPLAGVRVAVTRPAERADTLIQPLQAAGATVRCYPLIRIAGPPDPGGLRDAANRLDAYDWIIFTSASGVAALAAAAPPRSLTGPPPPRIAAIGPATAAALEAYGRGADLVADTSVSEGLAGALRAHGALEQARVLWPRAAGARPVLAAALRAAGAVVDDVVAYSTLPDGASAAALAAAVRAEEVDVLTFTSPSAVRSFSEAGGTIPVPVRVAVIGPVTAAAAEGQGFPVHIRPVDASAELLAAAIVEALGKRS